MDRAGGFESEHITTIASLLVDWLAVFSIGLCDPFLPGMMCLPAVVNGRPAKTFRRREKRTGMSYELIAGVDLGSNSFRLQIGRVVGDRSTRSIPERERPAGFRSDPREAARSCLATACDRGLAAFWRALRGFDPETVRAVTTDAMRVAAMRASSCRRPRRRWVSRSRSSAGARKRA
jgi:hypothetical protein